MTKRELSFFLTKWKKRTKTKSSFYSFVNLLLRKWNEMKLCNHHKKWELEKKKKCSKPFFFIFKQNTNCHVNERRNVSLKRYKKKDVGKSKAAEKCRVFCFCTEFFMICRFFFLHLHARSDLVVEVFHSLSTYILHSQLSSWNHFVFWM